jgi:hypothetical protein
MPQPEKRPRAEQLLDDLLGAVVVDDAAPEQVTDVGRQRVHRPLVAVERHCVIARRARSRDPRGSSTRAYV